MISGKTRILKAKGGFKIGSTIFVATNSIYKPLKSKLINMLFLNIFLKN